MLDKCMHPLLKEREQNLIKEKLQAAMKKFGFEYMLLTRDDNIFYATGYMPMGAGQVIAIVPAEGNVSLVVSTLESMDVRCATTDIDVHEFLSWVFIDDGTAAGLRDKGDLIDPNAVVNITADIIQPKKVTGRIGIESGSISHNLYTSLTEKIPETLMSDCTAAVMAARIIKTPWEIKILKIAAQHLERIWTHMAVEVKPGMPAYMLDTMMYEYAGMYDEYHSLMGGFSFVPAVGPYYGQSGMPRGYIIQDGDIIKFDVGFRHMGYTSDIARTFIVGDKPNKVAEEIYKILYDANLLGQEYLKPGVKCSEIYAIVRAAVEKSKLIP